jgi:hypothetical protein
MAGYQQSVYSGTRYPSEQMSKGTDAFDPPLPPGLEAQAMPGETWQEYYRRKGIPFPPGYDDTPRRRRRKAPSPDIEVAPAQNAPIQDAPIQEQATGEDDWFMGPPEQIIKEAPPVDERTIAVIQGAPWLERLKASILFDDQSVENWLRDKYSDDSVFRDVDDALYFLPPDEKVKPEDERTWVRFNPDGLDYGDFVTFVPGIVAGALAATGAGLVAGAGAGVLGTMAGAGAGGVAGEALLQGAGAMMADESHVPVSERAVRMGLAGSLEAATAGAGSLISRGVKEGVRVARRGAMEASERIALSGADPAEVAARRGVMARTDMPFSVGQETSGTIPLLVERVMRQNAVTSDIVKPADMANIEGMYRQASDLVQSLWEEGGEKGAFAAVDAHKGVLSTMRRVRARTFAEYMKQAKELVGDRRVVSTKHLKDTLRNLIKEESSHASTSEGDAIIDMATSQLERIGNGAATITELQNALKRFRVIADDGRGLSAQMQSPSEQKRIARRILDALHMDLDETVASGSKAEGGAAERLRQARQSYRDFSEIIGRVLDNPLSAYQADPEKVLSLLTKRTKDNRKLSAIMSFLDDASPDAANQLRARAIEEMLYKSANVTADEIVSPDKLATAAIKSRAQIDALLSGNPEAKKRFNDLVKTAQILKDRGPIFGSQTFTGNFINWLTTAGSAGALGGAAFLAGGDPAEMTNEIGVALLAALSARGIARSLFRSQDASNMRKLFNALRAKSPGPGPRAAARQALLDLYRSYRKYRDMLDGEDTQETAQQNLTQDQVTERAMRFAPAGL